MFRIQRYNLSVFQVDGVKIGEFGNQGFGLEVTQAMKQGEEVLSVLYEAMLTEETA